jgi:hypothetical protein
MADESHIHLLDREDFSEYDDKLRSWARSLDTTPERLKDILRGGGEGAKCVRELLGIKAAP